MSVQSNTYIMVGTMAPYDDFTEEQHEEQFEPYMDSPYKGIHHHNGLCVIADGMGGRYVAIGRVLAKTDDQNGDYGFSKPFDCTLAMTPELQREVATLIAQHFGFPATVRLWAFTHYR
ncbi:hypothetical protein ACX1DW_01490 [Stutzerimonas sp. KH-1]|jgi:serine/threonine protein phosphatase PrpC